MRLSLSLRLFLGILIFSVFFPVYSSIAEEVGLEEAKKQDSSFNASVKGHDYYAMVDGEKISVQAFQAAFQAGARKRFYHGKIPEEELSAFRKEVSDTLIDRVLLVKEAKRRGIKADKNSVDEQLKQYEKRYSTSKDWNKFKDQILAGLKSAIEEENILQQLQDSVRSVPEPRSHEVESYYNTHNELFTTPERKRVSLILLKVAPSSTGDVWQAAHEEAQRIVDKLRNGGDFAELARIHSGDETAMRGGDMGFLHQGMLAPIAENVLHNMQEADISDPVSLLKGVAIFKLEEKQANVLNKYAQVEERAKQLLMRELANTASEELLLNLRQNAEIKLNVANL